ncbi:MAG: DnaA N-terminal domain-containing protein [Candidatus Aphodocola sp.]
MNVIYTIRGNNISSSPTEVDIWEKVLNKIRENISSLAYATWFEDTSLLLINGDEAFIKVPKLIHKKLLKENYNDMITECLIEEINYRDKEDV